MNPKVDTFLSKVEKWQDELAKLRNIILDCGLNEELKWGVPCYTFHQSNVVLIHGFKEYCAIAFFKGALLCDEKGILVQQTENVQAARQIRFSSLDEIINLGNTIKAYIYEAIEVEKLGLKVDFKKNTELVFPEEFEDRLNSNPILKNAFDTLTPGRQRAYHLHFSESKQAKTRESRIEKCVPLILSGKGLHDCTCGLSKRMPQCDGSHKYLSIGSINSQK